MLKSPPMIQTKAIPPMNGTFLATLAGTMKIPDPITDPTTTQKASVGPRTLGSLASPTGVSVDMRPQFVARREEVRERPGSLAAGSGRGLGSWVGGRSCRG